MLQLATLKVEGAKGCIVSETIRIPSPVYRKATVKAEQQDVSRGVIIKQWMEKAEKYEHVEGQGY